MPSKHIGVIFIAFFSHRWVHQFVFPPPSWISLHTSALHSFAGIETDRYSLRCLESTLWPKKSPQELPVQKPGSFNERRWYSADVIGSLPWGVKEKCRWNKKILGFFPIRAAGQCFISIRCPEGSMPKYSITRLPPPPNTFSLLHYRIRHVSGQDASGEKSHVISDHC